MNWRAIRVLWALVGVNALASAFIGWFAWREHGHWVAEHQRNRRAQATARTEIGALRAAAMPDAACPASSALTPATPAASAQSGSIATACVEIAGRLRGNPEYAGCLRRNARLAVLRQYGESLKGLAITSEMRARVLDRLVETELASGDLTLACSSQGLSMQSPEAGQLSREIRNRSDADLREILGDEQFASFQRLLELNRSLKPLVSTLNAALEEKALPPVSLEQLLAAAAKPTAPRWPSPDAQTRAAELEQHVRTQFASILTPAQLDVAVQHFQARMRSVQLMRETAKRLRQ